MKAATWFIALNVALAAINLVSFAVTGSIANLVVAALNAVAAWGLVRYG